MTHLTEYLLFAVLGVVAGVVGVGFTRILYAVEDGERQVVNYALRGDTIVADRVLRRAALVVGSGRGERTLAIENRSPARPEEGGR